MRTFILTTADGAEHRIVSTDVLTALMGWVHGYAGTKYSAADVIGIHDQEA